jgi:hypothetical protein
MGAHIILLQNIYMHLLPRIYQALEKINYAIIPKLVRLRTIFYISLSQNHTVQYFKIQFNAQKQGLQMVF